MTPDMSIVLELDASFEALKRAYSILLASNQRDIAALVLTAIEDVGQAICQHTLKRAERSVLRSVP